MRSKKCRQLRNEILYQLRRRRRDLFPEVRHPSRHPRICAVLSPPNYPVASGAAGEVGIFVVEELVIFLQLDVVVRASGTLWWHWGTLAETQNYREMTPNAVAAATTLNLLRAHVRSLRGTYDKMWRCISGNPVKKYVYCEPEGDGSDREKMIRLQEYIEAHVRLIEERRKDIERSPVAQREWKKSNRGRVAGKPSCSWTSNLWCLLNCAGAI